MRNEEEELISKLEARINNLKNLYKRYKRAYVSLLKKFRKLLMKRESKNEKLKDLLRELDYLLVEIENDFKKLNELDKRLSKIEEDVWLLKVRLEKVEKNLFNSIEDRYIK